MERGKTAVQSHGIWPPFSSQVAWSEAGNTLLEPAVLGNRRLGARTVKPAVLGTSLGLPASQSFASST